MTTTTTAAVVALGVGAAATVVARQLGLDEAAAAAALAARSRPRLAPRTLFVVGSDFAKNKRWSRVVDVVVVGSGAAGLQAALSALWANPKLSVLVVERDVSVGGTTAKSGGVFWFPDNVLMARGVDDPAKAAKFLARVAFPDLFNEADEENYGLGEQLAERVRAYVEVGRTLPKQLRDSGVTPDLNQVTTPDKAEVVVDYSYEPRRQPDNANPRGRHLAVGMPPFPTNLVRGLRRAIVAATPLIVKLGESVSPAFKELLLLDSFGIDLTMGVGPVMVERLSQGVAALGGRIETGRGVEALVVDVEDGAAPGSVAGVMLEGGEYVGARRGVIFATGGFSHDPELMKQHVAERGKFDQTGASKCNDGSFLKMASKLGAKLEHLDKVWGCEAFYDDAEWESETCLFQFRGDSFFTVNGDGVRVYNEKAEYDVRRRAHALKPENEVLFAVCDARCLREFGSDVAKSWPRDPNDARYVRGNTMAELAANIRKRYGGATPTKAKAVPRPHFTSAFESNLVSVTLPRFNSLAAAGKDPDFGRGEADSDRQWTRPPSRDGGKNPAMKPLQDQGPFFAIAIVASVIDTKGGPAVDRYQRVLHEDTGAPIPRLYAAGNCCSPVSGDAYVSGGHTLGSAMVGGYLAGLHAAALSGSVAKL